jgi:hypothetical protein
MKLAAVVESVALCVARLVCIHHSQIAEQRVLLKNLALVRLPSQVTSCLTEFWQKPFRVWHRYHVLVLEDFLLLFKDEKY